MKRDLSNLSHLFAAFGLAVMAASCSGKGDDRPVIAVSIEPQRYILEQIVGDNYRVVSVMPSGSDPESYEPSMAVRADVDNSDIYFTLGVLPFENALQLSAAENVKIVNTTRDIKPIYGTHEHNHATFLGLDDDELQMPDPHFWASVRNMRLMAGVMARNMQKLDPDNAEEYNNRYLVLDHHLDSLDRSYAERLDTLSVKTFVVWHPTLSYFARDYGLEQLAVSDDNKDVSIHAMHAVINDANNRQARVFFDEGYCNSQQAETMTSAINARAAALNLSGYDWEEQMEHIVDELTRL